MATLLKGLLCTGFGVLLATAVHANTVEKIFPHAESVAEHRENDVHYLLPLGRVKEDPDAGRVQPSKYQSLDGNLVSITWRLDSDLSLQDARTQVNTFLAAQKLKPLFQCEGRDCGESFSWSDAIFHQAVLFGSDRTQHVWVILDHDAPRYHVLYLVERPNRRTYLHEDTLIVPQHMRSAQQAIEAINNNGSVIVAAVPMLNGKANFDTVLQRVAAWKSEIALPLVLVLHRQGDAAREEGLANQLRTLLKARKIEGRVEDVGPFAPNPDAPDSVWVEWVNPQWKPD